ncbi:MAG: hypothetical protein AB2L14_13355 [Candidatus Xenobiia bacterium LiM19]
MIKAINPKVNMKGTGAMNFKSAALPAKNAMAKHAARHGADGFTASRETRQGGFANGMPSPTTLQTPQAKDSTGDLLKMTGISLLGNFLNKLIDRIFGGGGGGGGQVNGGGGGGRNGGQIDGGGGFDDNENLDDDQAIDDDDIEN